MIVDCPSCGATYNISDDKVRGRRVRVRCKTCGEGIVVDGAALDDATRVYSPTFEPAAYSEDRDESTRVMSAGGPEWREPGPDDWTVNLSETEQRTMNHAELLAAYKSGEIGDDAFVWRDGMADWLPVNEIPEIRAALESSEATRVMSQAAMDMSEATRVMSPAAVRAAAGPPMGAAARRAALNAPTMPTPVTYAAPAAPPPAHRPVEQAPPSVEYAPPLRLEKPAARAPAARVREGRARQDLFGGGGTPGGEAELLASSSMPLEQYEEKPTGARNESSVLFSLNALKAGAPTGGPSSNPPRMLAAAPPTAADILGMSAGGTLPGMDASAALLSAPMVEAPALAAPPASFERPRDRMDTTPPTKRSKPPLALIAAVLVLAATVAGSAFFVVKSRSGATTPPAESAAAAIAPAPTAAPAPTPAAPAPEPPKAAAPAPEPPPPAEAPATPAPATPPVAAAPPAVAAPTPSPAPAPKAASPGGGATPAPKAEPKAGTDKTGKVVLAEEPAPAAPAPAAPAPAEEEKPDEPAAPPFDKEAAKAALGTASAGAANCKKPDGPTGSGKVTVTFSPSGRVTSANVTEGPFGGTPVGGCVAKLFRAARVPAFSGDPVTVAKGFSIPE